MIQIFNQKTTVTVSYLAMLLSVVLSPFVGSVAILFAVAVFAVSCIFLNHQYAYALLFGVFPFANIFKLNAASMSMITVCEIILCLFILVEKNVLKKDLRINFRFFISLILISVITVVFCIDAFNCTDLIKLIVKSLLLYHFFRSDNDIKIKENAFAAIAVVLSVSMIVMMFISLSSDYYDSVIDYLRVVKYGAETDLIRNSGLMIDPNYCSMAIVITISMLSVLYFFGKINVLFWILSVPLFCIGFTTYSKSYFLCAIVFLILLLLYILYPRHKMSLLWVFAACTVFAIFCFQGRIEAVNLVIARFKEGDLTTGRSSLNATYFDYIINDYKVLFFGEGYSVASISWTNNVHNLYLEMLFRLGIVGSIIYLFVIFSCFPNKTKKIKFICYLPLSFMLIMYSALAGLSSYELMYYIIICAGSVFFVDYKKERKYEKNETL